MNMVFQFQIIWIFWLFFNGDGVDVVVDICVCGYVYIVFVGFSKQLVDQILSMFNIFFMDDWFDCLELVVSFDWIYVIWEMF